MRGNRFITSPVPSVEPLSTTTMCGRGACASSAVRQSGKRWAPFHVTTIACTEGASFATPSGSLIDVGINAAPLAAARTGVGRYIAGLLDALESHPQDGLRTRPLFL